MATYVLLHGAYQGGWIWQPVARKVKKSECLAVAAFRTPLLPIYLLAILLPEASSSSLVASHHFGGSTEIGKNVSLAFLQLPQDGCRQRCVRLGCVGTPRYE